jgi:hypothetical protein
VSHHQAGHQTSV